MIIKGKFNTGNALRDYEDCILQPGQFGKFGVSAYTEYGFNIGEEFFVVGMLLIKGNLNYLIDNGGAGIYPYQLFEVVDPNIPLGWYFNAFSSNDIQAIWGYEEWCFDSKHRDGLIEMDEDACIVFYQRKSELEKMGIFDNT